MAEPEKLELTERMITNVNSAFANGKPIVVAYVDDEEQPHLSFRGSTQVYSSDQLAIWIRDLEGGLLENLGRHPRMTLLYRDGESRTTYILGGRAKVDEDEEVRRVVYENSDERERNRDPERKGKAVIVDLDTVQASEGDERHFMRRA